MMLTIFICSCLILCTYFVKIRSDSVGSSHPCHFDLEQICGISDFPTTQSQIYEARLCLGSNANLVSNSCYDYFHYESPSIVESCTNEILKSCKNIPPYINEVKSCLQRNYASLGVACKESFNLQKKSDTFNWPSHDVNLDFAPELNDYNSLLDAVSSSLMDKVFIQEYSENEKKNVENIPSMKASQQLQNNIFEMNRKIALRKKPN